MLTLLCSHWTTPTLFSPKGSSSGCTDTFHESG